MRITQPTLGGRGGRDTNPMKNPKTCFRTFAFDRYLGHSNASFAVNGIILKEEVSSDSYCHLKFPVIREGTLARTHPVLKVPSSTRVKSEPTQDSL
jgi:hypothetical protein